MSETPYNTEYTRTIDKSIKHTKSAIVTNVSNAHFHSQRAVRRFPLAPEPVDQLQGVLTRRKKDLHGDHAEKYYPTREDVNRVLYFHNASTDVYDGVERRDSTWIAHHEFWLKQFRSTAHEHGTEIAENILDALGGRPKFMLEVPA